MWLDFDKTNSLETPNSPQASLPGGSILISDIRRDKPFFAWKPCENLIWEQMPWKEMLMLVKTCHNYPLLPVISPVGRVNSQQAPGLERTVTREEITHTLNEL